MEMKKVALIVIALIAIVGCTSKQKEIQRIVDSPLAVDSHVEEGTDFNRFATWNWVPMPKTGMEDERTRDAAITAMIEEAFETEMFSRGYRRVDSAYDLIANYHFAVEAIDEAYIDTYYGGKFPDYKVDMTGTKDDNQSWQEGTVIFFLFESRTGQLVWQASVQAEVTDKSTPEQAEARIKKAAKMMFEKFPKRSS
jgi:hypothetical protein